MDRILGSINTEIKINPKKKYVKKEIKYIKDVPTEDKKCTLAYYYPDYNMFKTLNLNPGPRPWFSFKLKDGSTISGYDAFANPYLYKPSLMYKYINKYFIEPFSSKGIQSPYIYTKGSKNTSENFEIQLGSHQKFGAQIINPLTNFKSAMFFHGLGAGKTNVAIEIGEANKSLYNVLNDIKIIPENQIHVKDNDIKNTIITIVVPKNLIATYVNELIGKINNGNINSAVNSSIIYCEDDKIDKHNYATFRQYYQGVMVQDIKTGLTHFKDNQLQNLANFKDKLAIIENDINLLKNDITGSKFSDQEKRKLTVILDKKKKEQRNIINQIKSIQKSIENNRINGVYFIVSMNTFIKRLTQKNIYADKTASNFVLGLSDFDTSNKGGSFIGEPPSPDFLHTDNAIIIFDEIQKLTSSNSYDTLYNTLFLYARNYLTRKNTMKVIVLTATPVHDNPYQLAQICNLLRPRMQFPRNRNKFYDLFVKNNNINNKNLFKYMLTGTCISYFKGGDPIDYPYIRNIIKCHQMSSKQYNLYEQALISDIKESKENEIRFDYNEYYSSEESAKSSIFRRSRNISMITDTDNIKFEKFEEYSPKLYNVAHILMNSNGNVYVHSSFIERGLIPLSQYLKYLGCEIINENNINVKKSNKIRVGLWSDKLLSHYDIKNKDEYKKKLLDLCNKRSTEETKNYIIILANILEGVSFFGITQTHLLDPWWNESTMQQIIGRTIRFLSHSHLPKNRQYIDVYYHATVLNTFPEQNESLKETLANARLGSSQHQLNFYSTYSIEQRVYMIANRKNKLNKKFEICAKEVSIDYDLNKEANIIRLDQMVLPDISDNKNDVILYNKSTDEYYCLKENNKLFLISKTDTWPLINYDITKNEIKYSQITITKDNNGSNMYDIYMYEDIQSFIHGPLKDMNFYELKEYSVKNGEDIKAWNYIENLYKINNLFTLLLQTCEIVELPRRISRCKNGK